MFIPCYTTFGVATHIRTSAASYEVLQLDWLTFLFEWTPAIEPSSNCGWIYTHQPAFHVHIDRFRASGNLKLLQNMRNVYFDCGFADVKYGAYLPVTFAPTLQCRQAAFISTISWLCRGSLYGSLDHRSWAVAHQRTGSNLSDRWSPAIAPGTDHSADQAACGCRPRFVTPAETIAKLEHRQGVEPSNADAAPYIWRVCAIRQRLARPATRQPFRHLYR